DLSALTQGRAPEARFVSVKQEGKSATLEVELKAQGAELLRYNIFANDVPLFGPLGKPVAGAGGRLTERIDLGAGRNKIEVGALDAAGLESLRAFRVIDLPEQPAKRRLYYIGFGISKYKNPKYNLMYAHKDVLDLGEVLRASAGDAFAEVHAHAFVNEQATVE